MSKDLPKNNSEEPQVISSPAESSKQAVQKALDYAESIVNTIHEPLLVMSEKLRVVSANRSFYQTFKVAPKETEGKFIYNLGNKQWDIPKLRQLLEEILPEKTTFNNFRVEHSFPKIGKRIMLLNARRVPPPPAQPERILLAIEDITRQKEMSRDIVALKEVDKMKTEFLSTAAHQLRTPLGSMRWNMEMLLGGDFGKVPKLIKEAIQQIYESNQRLIGLVNNLLDVSRIEQGLVQNNLEATDLLKIIKDVIEKMEPEAEKRAVTVDLKIKKDHLPAAMINPRRFRDVIQNLLSNAVKYNLRGGKATITVDRLNKKIQISIANTGPAIPKEDQSKLFSKFFRGSNAVKSEVEGSGLGLFLAKSYVEDWGGKIRFKSPAFDNKGSIFYVEVPLKSKKRTLDKNLTAQSHKVKKR